MATKVYGFNEEGYNRVREATRRVLGQPRVGSQRTARQPVFSETAIRDAELTANLSPASNSKTGASTASAKFLVPDPDNDGDLMDGDTFTVTNRSLDASGLNGDYIVVARVSGEWRPIWMDC